MFIPEYVVGHWWEQILHNQSALRLKGRLLFKPGVMVMSVPWQLKSSERIVERAEVTAGAYRRAYGPAPARRPARGAVAGVGPGPHEGRPGSGTPPDGARAADRPRSAARRCRARCRSTRTRPA